MPIVLGFSKTYTLLPQAKTVLLAVVTKPVIAAAAANLHFVRHTDVSAYQNAARCTSGRFGGPHRSVLNLNQGPQWAVHADRHQGRRTAVRCVAALLPA